MPCYRPITGYRSKDKNANGKRPIVFTLVEGFIDRPVQFGCGKCIGCKLKHSSEWAIRCIHEASLYPQNSNAFLSMTYAPHMLPQNCSLVKSDLQKFFKRLRKAISPRKIKYLAIGEYGDQTHRPHYHALVFNYGFPDKKLKKLSYSGHRLYISEELDKIWGHGHCWIGDLTFQTAAYCARYSMKKIFKHSLSYEDNGITPEFLTCSNGIGRKFINSKMERDNALRDGYFVHNGKKYPIPRYYDKIFELEEPIRQNILSIMRKKAAQEKYKEDSLRLDQKEEYKTKVLSLLRRQL